MVTEKFQTDLIHSLVLVLDLNIPIEKKPPQTLFAEVHIASNSMKVGAASRPAHLG